MQRKLLILLLAALVTCCLGVTAQAADAPTKIRVLIITGDDVAPAHDWREISEATRAVLVNAGRFEVNVCEDPLILESETALGAYDVIAFLMFNRRVPEITDQAKENLLNFVKGGKGFFVQHLASASFAKWDEFGRLCGRRWVMGSSGHGPRVPFEAKVVDAEHPITKGLTDFQVDDELYAKLQGDGPIHVLVQADSDWSKRTEPLVFTLEYGKGRTVHQCFGHDRKAIMTPSVQKIIARGVQWAATGKVAED